MIDVLIVDDSPIARQLLEHVLSADPELHVVGQAGGGEEAFQLMARHKPDVITMDVEMPAMNGFEVTRRIMATNPIPIVIVTASYDPTMVSKAFAAVEAGAMAILAKPPGVDHPDYARLAAEIVKNVKAMAGVKLVRRVWPRASAAPLPRTITANEVKQGSRRVEVIAVGASTGGPQAIETILAGLPKGFPIPMLIVQHMSVGFVQGFVDWLNMTSGPRVVMAGAGDSLRAGHAYVAPNGFQMGVTQSRTISLAQDKTQNRFCPSVGHLFRSVASAYGEQAAGVLLTGMGDDGAEELKLMRAAGALTVAQDKASSIVYGMPGEAMKLHAAECSMSPPEIAVLLAGLSRG